MDKLAPKAMERVRQTVLEQCPGLDDVAPTVTVKTSPASSEGASDLLFVLTFRQKVELEDGSRMTHIVRVTADEQGRVIKLAASR